MALTELTPITIDRRFSGPPDSGHGGYVGGLMAGYLGDGVEVTLRRPPPLERPLRLRANAHRSQLDLLDGDLLVASARTVQLELGALPGATFEQAVAASQRTLVTLDNHRFPYCFACGPLREAGDGLRLLAGPLQHKQSEGRTPFATPWRPHFMSPTRWDVIAEGMGCHGEYVERAEQLEPALQRARQEQRPSLVCFTTDREMNLHPPGTEVFGEVYTGPED